jgi:hypothetical protein
MKTLVFGLFALVAASSLSAESLHGDFRGEVVPDGPPVVMGLDDLVQISLPASAKFTRAVEIEIAVPREVFPYRSNLACFIYQNFQLGKAPGGPTGERIGIEVLPPASKFYLQAPLVPKAGLKASVDTAVLKTVKFEASFPLVLTILPIDKELPPGWEKFQFTVKARFIHSNLGAVNLVTPALSDEDRQRLKITANGVAQPAVGPLLLEPGPYTLEVTLPGMDSVTVNVMVAQAKTVDVPVELAMEDPSVVIEAPEGTQVVIDGKRLAWKPSATYPIDRGTHSVQFVIGNTVVADSFTVDKGGRHRLTLKMAVSLSRE